MLQQTRENRIARPDLSEQQTVQLASEAYIFGYPLVLLDVTRQVMTNVAQADETAAPVNQLGSMRSFPDDGMTTVVSPNADTLYTFGFLDLSKGPMILSIPEMGRRYYLMQMLDAWTNVFASPGTRATGNGAADFAIVGPARSGSLPERVKVIKSPTSTVWIIGRTQTNGKVDYSAVHKLQNQYKLTSLSAWGKPYILPDDAPVDRTIDMATPPVDQVAKMDAATFFCRLNALMKNNPSALADAQALSRFAPIGVVPAQPFDRRGFSVAVVEGLEEGVDAGRAAIVAEAKKPLGKIINGWQFLTDVGRYGTDYLRRSVVALVGLGANLPEDAIYASATSDSSGQPLTGANTYEIHFPAGQLPPVGAFWSITMYNSRQFFVRNPIQRYAVGDRDKLTFDTDGSLTIYVQNESPGANRESNWLPAPKDLFNLMMRLYWPKKEIIDGTWKPPEVTNVQARKRQVA